MSEAARGSMTDEIDLKKKDKKDEESFKAIAAMARRAAVASEARNAARERTLSSGRVVSKAEVEALDRLEERLVENEFEKALADHDFDLALELIEKAAHHKYIRRIPSKREGRKWEYIYNVGSAKHGRTPEVGEKIRVAHGEQQGHYEVTHDHGTHVTLTHDETGHTMRMEKEHVNELFRQEHEAAIEEKHRKLKRTREAARVHGSPKQRERAERAVKEHRERHGIGKEREDKPKPKEVKKPEPKAEREPTFTGVDARRAKEEVGRLNRQARNKIRELISQGKYKEAAAAADEAAKDLNKRADDFKQAVWDKIPSQYEAARNARGVHQVMQGAASYLVNSKLNLLERARKEAAKTESTRAVERAAEQKMDAAMATAKKRNQERKAAEKEAAKLEERKKDWEKRAGIKFPETVDDLWRESEKTFHESIAIDDKNKKLDEAGKPIDEEAIDKQTAKVAAIKELVDQQDWSKHEEGEPLYRWPSSAGNYKRHRERTAESKKVKGGLTESHLTEMKPHSSIFVENNMGKQFKITSGKNNRDWYLVQDVDTSDPDWEDRSGSRLDPHSAFVWVGGEDAQYGQPRLINRGDIKGATDVVDTKIPDASKQRDHAEAGAQWAEKVYDEKMKDPDKLPKLGFQDADPRFLAARHIEGIANRKLFIGHAQPGVAERKERNLSAKDKQFWRGVLKWAQKKSDIDTSLPTAGEKKKYAEGLAAAEKDRKEREAKQAQQQEKEAQARQAHEERPGATASKLVSLAIEKQNLNSAKMGVKALEELAQQPGMKGKALKELRDLLKEARTIAKRRQGGKYSRQELETARAIRDHIDNARASIAGSKRSEGETTAGKFVEAVKQSREEGEKAKESGNALIEKHRNDPDTVVVATSQGPQKKKSIYTRGQYSAHEEGGEFVITHRPSGMKITTQPTPEKAAGFVQHMDQHAANALSNLPHGASPHGAGYETGKAEMLNAFRSFADNPRSVDPKAKPAKPKKVSNQMGVNLARMSRGYSTFFTDVKGGAAAMYDLKHHGLVTEGKLEGSYVLTDKGKKAAKEGKFEPVPYTRKSLEQEALARLQNRLAKSDNSVDVDMDAGFSGVAEYGGQVAMRVHHNEKCNGCNHYDHNQSACEIGMVPKVCGDGSHPEIGYNPASPNRIAAKNWMMRHKNAVVSSPSVGEHGSDVGEVPYRVEVLGDSALALSERMTLVKAAARDKAAIAAHIWHHVAGPKARAKWESKGCGGKKKHEGKGRPPKEFIEHIANKGLDDELILSAVADITGVELRGPMQCDLHKGNLSLNEFADAMGTTTDVVRSIARRLGSRHDFAEFIKSKLPDIRMAHGLDEDAVGRLYESAQRTVKSLSPTQWELWKGVSFETGVDDESLATAIAQHGLMDPNALHGNGIITPAEPRSALPPPEPIQDPEQKPVGPTWIGGNLHLATEI